jgi:hypothetical protein
MTKTQDTAGAEPTKVVQPQARTPRDLQSFAFQNANDDSMRQYRDPEKKK